MSAAIDNPATEIDELLQERAASPISADPPVNPFHALRTCAAANVSSSFDTVFLTSSATTDSSAEDLSTEALQLALSGLVSDKTVLFVHQSVFQNTARGMLPDCIGEHELCHWFAVHKTPPVAVQGGAASSKKRKHADEEANTSAETQPADPKEYVCEWWGAAPVVVSASAKPHNSVFTSDTVNRANERIASNSAFGRVVVDHIGVYAVKANSEYVKKQILMPNCDNIIQVPCGKSRQLIRTVLEHIQLYVLGATRLLAFVGPAPTDSIGLDKEHQKQSRGWVSAVLTPSLLSASQEHGWTYANSSADRLLSNASGAGSGTGLLRMLAWINHAENVSSVAVAAAAAKKSAATKPVKDTAKGGRSSFPYGSLLKMMSADFAVYADSSSPEAQLAVHTSNRVLRTSWPHPSSEAFGRLDTAAIRTLLKRATISAYSKYGVDMKSVRAATGKGAVDSKSGRGKGLGRKKASAAADSTVSVSADGGVAADKKKRRKRRTKKVLLPGEVPKKRRNNQPNVFVSDAMRKFIVEDAGCEDKMYKGRSIRRTEWARVAWVYYRKAGIQNPTEKTKIDIDEKLMTLLKLPETPAEGEPPLDPEITKITPSDASPLGIAITFFKINSYINHNFLAVDQESVEEDRAAAAAEKLQEAAASVEEAAAAVEKLQDGAAEE